jgi:prepilin-type N-terminal cleavage/methylation domain-containing protein
MNFARVVSRSRGRRNGFSLIELIIAIGVMAVLMAIAMPTVSIWRQQAQTRRAAREVVSMLREARGTAIALNTAVTVSISSATPPLVGFVTSQGTRTYAPDAKVGLAPSFAPQFNPDGTAATTGTIAVKDLVANKTSYTISVEMTGRARIN